MKTIGGVLLFAFLMVQAQTLKSGVGDAISLQLETISATVLDDVSAQNFKDGSRYATFKLDLEAGSVTEFRVIADFDTYATLYSPSFELLQSNDEAQDSDGITDNHESVIVQEAVESGTYLLVVSGYYATSVGAFEVTPKNITVADDGPLTLPASVNAVLSSDEESDDDGRYLDTFTLELATPATLTFTMHSDVIDGYLKIYDSNGDLIAENDDKEFVDDPATTDVDESSDYTLDAELELELAAGSYEVQALSYTSGFYQLFVQGEGEAVTTPSLTPSKPSTKPEAKPSN
jgi:hypothetical protein